MLTALAIIAGLLGLAVVGLLYVIGHAAGGNRR